MDGRIIPDPANGSTIEAKAVFQAASPNGAVVLDVTRHRLSLTDYTWTVTYRTEFNFPSPKDFDCVRAKAKFQQAKPTNSKCKSLTACETAAGMWIWTLDYALAPTRTLGEYLTSCLTCCTVRTTSGIPSKELKKIRPNQCTIEVTRTEKKIKVGLDDVKEEDLPHKLIYKGCNVTRKFFTRTRLSKYDIEVLRRQRNVPQKYFKKFVPPENRNTNDEEGAALLIDEHAEEVCESASPPVLEPATSSAAIPFDYSTVDHRYMKSRLNDYSTLLLAIDHLHMSQFRMHPVCEKTSAGQKRSLFCRLQLSALGLPTDESLLDLFISLCKDRGISSDDAISVIRDVDRPTPLLITT